MYDLTTPNQSSGPMSFEQIHDRLSVDMNDEAAAADLRSRILRWVIDDRIMDHLVVGGEDVINETLYLVQWVCERALHECSEGSMVEPPGGSV